VDQLHDKIINDSTLVILDVRTPEELTGPLGKLDDVINIPLQELESRLSELEKFRNQEIDVICKIGKRSAAATDFLLQNGFNAVNVLGGMVEYRTKIGNNNDSTE
ncbi:MAG: rhodanese-like domain-containing protein, partial [Ignavibacteriaceae bacterium]|nr:rhodanese-like domain-containing protein [Ignavibacteriaceae bacterium]